MPSRSFFATTTRVVLVLAAIPVLSACAGSAAVDEPVDKPMERSSAPTSLDAARTVMPADPAAPSARVTAVLVNGGPQGYTFVVTVESPDSGCEQYADWWEVVGDDGETLLYRLVLQHSHTNEQPFTRSGGPVDIGPDDVVAVRAHMNTSGYGTVFMLGNVSGGFESGAAKAQRFAPGLELEGTQPTGCAF